jgi:hypothetical protein
VIGNGNFLFGATKLSRAHRLQTITPCARTLVSLFSGIALALTGCGAGPHPSAAASPAATPTLGSSQPRGATPAPSISPVPNTETGAAANPQPTAARLVARDLVWPWLIGMDAHYVYWLNHDPREDAPGYADYVGHLMRAPRVGGIGETVLDDVVGAKVECGVAGSANMLFLVASGNHTTQSILAVPTRRNGSESARVFREGVSACNLLVSGGRLFWTEAGPGERPFQLRDAEERKDDAAHASLHSANVDGSDERVLWRSPDECAPLRLLEDGGSLILLLAPPEPEFGLGSIGTLGHESARSSAEPKLATRSSVMTISKSGGTSRELWSAPGKLRFAGVDGADLLLCAEDGLYRLPFARAGQAARVWAQTCPYDIQVWKGWGLFGPSDREEPAQLRAENLSQRGGRLVLLPILLGPFGFMVEGEDLYACVHGSKEPEGHCDLVRADSNLLKARAAEGGHLP